MERSRFKITEVSKKIICMVIVLVMLASNFISPAKSLAVELNNDANVANTADTAVADENNEGKGVTSDNADESDESENVDNIDNNADNKDDTQAKIDEIEENFEAAKNKEENEGETNNSSEDEDDKKQTIETDETQPNNTRELRSVAPALHGAATPQANIIEDSLSPDLKNEITEKISNANYEINKFDTEFVSGATRDSSGNWVWTPTSIATGHEFTFRVNYSLSGLKELPAEALKITIPKTILVNKDGNQADRYLMSLPNDKEYDGGSDFTYAEKEGYIVVYNPEEISAGVNGYFEVSYVTTKSTMEYKDYDKTETNTIKNGGTASNPFNAVVTVKTIVNDTEDTLARVSDDKNIFIDTTAQVRSTQKCYPIIYRSWNDAWTEEAPEDKDEYYYLIWEVKTYIDPATQKYRFTLMDMIKDLTDNSTGEDYQIVGYKLAGERYFSNVDTKQNQTINGYRYDYVLTRHKIETYKDKEYTLKNTVVVRVDPEDQVDDDTYATSSNTFFWDPAFEPPTGSFNLFKYGNNNWREKFSYYWDYANYDLDKLQGGEVDELKGFKYLTETIGYAYPWTLREGGSLDNYEDYGYNNVNYESWDDTLYLEDDTIQLTKDDYYLDYLTYSIDDRDAKYDEFENKFNESFVRYEDNETIIFYGKFNGSDEWIQIGINNLQTKELTQNDTYVESFTKDTIKFKTGVNCTGWRFTTSNKNYKTHIYVAPWYVLKNSDYVMNKAQDKDSIKLTNIFNMKVTDNNNEVIFEDETSAVDYARVTYYTSNIYKNVVSSSNNVSKRLYKISWKMGAWEKVTSGVENGRAEYLKQENGKFYDLIPSGGEIDLDSIQVQTEKGFLSSNEFTYELIPNYKNSGRTMLVVDINIQAQYYNVLYTTIHPWNSMVDYGRKVLNPVAYETGNEKIAKGFPDDGGKLSNENKAIFYDLDNTTNDEKFIYYESPYNINAITAGIAGLNKKVKNPKDKEYFYEAEIEPNKNYSYQLRFQNTYFSKAKDLIFYDSIENFKIINSTEGTVTESTWRGTLQSIDVNQLKKKGINAVIYVSDVENLNIEENKDLTDASVWVVANTLTDYSRVKAIAIDMSKDVNGNDFVLNPGDSVIAVLNMVAPNEVSEEAELRPYTYNNIYLNNTLVDDVDGDKEYFIHQDYTRLKYHVVADVPFVKVNENDETEGIKGITFKLYGTSLYGKSVDEYVTSDANGNVVFKDIEAGEYILQEYEGTPDWIEDHTEHRVVINKKGAVYIDDELANGMFSIKITNKKRIHTDVTIKKKILKQKDQLKELNLNYREHQNMEMKY